MNGERGLPTGWVWATLSDLAEVSTGTTPNRGVPRFWQNGAVPWVTSSAVNQLAVAHAEEFVTEAALRETNLRLYPKHTLLLALYGEGKTRGKVSELLIDATINQALAALQLHGAAAACRGYLKAFLLGHYSKLRRQAAGGMQPNLNLGLVRKIDLPLAPLDEQRRIVAKVDELLSDLEAGVSALKRAQANLKRYRAAVLRAAVTGAMTAGWRASHSDVEPSEKLLDRILAERRREWEEDQTTRINAAGKMLPKNWQAKYAGPASPDTRGLPELPKGWCWASLEALTSAVRPICYGILMPKEHIPGGVPYVKVRDMKGDVIDVEGLSRTSSSIAANYARASLEGGDVLLAIRGTFGRVALVPDELAGGNITQDTARLALSSLLSAGFVATTLRSSLCQNYFKRVARGVAVKGVNIADVRRCPIPLAPLAEQDGIVADVEQAFYISAATESLLDTNLRRASRLRQSILKDAFAGRLVPQDPNDEPASELLERIRQERAAANGTGKEVSFRGRRRVTKQPELYE